MEILLRQDDVDLNKPGESGKTPLWWVARNGYVGIVEMLLGRDDINLDRSDKHD